MDVSVYRYVNGQKSAKPLTKFICESMDEFILFAKSNGYEKMRYGIWMGNSYRVKSGMAQIYLYID